MCARVCVRVCICIDPPAEIGSACIVGHGLAKSSWKLCTLVDGRRYTRLGHASLFHPCTQTRPIVNAGWRWKSTLTRPLNPSQLEDFQEHCCGYRYRALQIARKQSLNCNNIIYGIASLIILFFFRSPSFPFIFLFFQFFFFRSVWNSNRYIYIYVSSRIRLLWKLVSNPSKRG